MLLLGDFDVLIGFLNHHNYVAVSAVVIADQVAGAGLLPARTVYSAPWEIPKRGVRTQRAPARTVGATVVWAAAWAAGPLSVRPARMPSPINTASRFLFMPKEW